MRVVVNGLAALKPKTGVGHHVANLAAALAAEFPDDTFDLYPGERVADLARRFARPPAPPSAGAPRPRPIKAWATSMAKSVARWASRVHFGAYSYSGRFDLYHEPNFIPFPSRLPTVVTVHDLSVLRFPEWHPADRVKMHTQHFIDGIQRAAHVITVSETVRNEMIDEMNLPPSRVTTVYNGVSRAFRPLPESDVAAVKAGLGLPDRYFLCVGTIEPRKNLGTAMRAFADLPSAVRAACPLVLAGPWGWQAEAEREFFHTTGRAAGVRHVGYVADADLPAVYCGATGLVYPSHYEGFGLPLVEMLACGGAVLASTAAAVREVCGPCAAFINPDDVQGWRDAMMRLATDNDYRSALSSSGGAARARSFTWERAARETVDVYKKVLQPPPRPAQSQVAVLGVTPRSSGSRNPAA
ncbi:glycosyltransferase family 4 protein [Fimbriiglobus ruber]|uniref:Glycosyltransferase n=1 Tax=Fimbriiglobus ruber TaxID=1908690 RepID=A0A225E311_9BACT|nr:glycosyltransferase family 1 protein [Fimbriiglobus ruber]OWK44466.1 Glycosyltransferase [Fimbriiglobus ruber]